MRCYVDPSRAGAILFGWALAFPSLLACTGELGGPEDDGKSELPRAGDEPTDIFDETWSEDPEIDPFRPLVRRLTRDELRYTVLDVLGVDLSEEDMAVIPIDRPLEGFVNVATSQTVLPEHVEGYSKLSATISQKMDWEAKRAAWGVCTEPNEQCAGDLVDALGAELFRRPISDAERAAFLELSLSVMSEPEGDFLSVSDAVLRAMLQAPAFLYRIESETSAATGLGAGEAKAVTGYEMATRLSYLVWASAPDELLIQAARDGALDSPAGILEQLARMLGDEERARRVTDRYITDWGRLEALPDDGGLRAELIESLVATYSHMLWDRSLSVTEVFSDPEIFLTEDLAANFGIEPSGPGLLLYDLREVPGRVGLLTHPGLVAGMTNADGGAIVARGLFLQAQMFCKETPSPPMGLQDAIDAFLEEMPPTASDRMIAEARLTRTECGTCHGGFDPLAYGLEQFDYQGRYRTVDEYENALSTDGWIPGRVRIEGDDVPYSSVEELASLLQGEPAVLRCITEQHLKYALGRTLAPELVPLITGVFEQFDEAGGTYPAMLEAIAQHDLFRKMKVE